MRENDMFRFTLVAEGSSDAILVPILKWSLRERGIAQSIEGKWADLRVFRKSSGLDERIRRAVDHYPCDLLFIHRDADTHPREIRVGEISGATLRCKGEVPPVIPVVPVRMQEAWLLLDEMAIRQAANNRNGRERLPLPPIQRIEQLPDPKECLYDLIRQASGLTGRRLKKLRPDFCATRILDFMENKTVLRQLPAFLAFERDLADVLERYSLIH